MGWSKSHLRSQNQGLTQLTRYRCVFMFMCVCVCEHDHTRQLQMYVLGAGGGVAATCSPQGDPS